MVQRAMSASRSAFPAATPSREKTMNSRLGILGGLSILGTTGIVVPYSCAAWIHSIHRGIDVARADRPHPHRGLARGRRPRRRSRNCTVLEDTALIDMGDFVGGMLKYARSHPVQRVTIAGGFAKMTKLAQGLLDLHSRSGHVDCAWLANLLREAGAPADLFESASHANTALHVLQLAEARGIPAGDLVAAAARKTASGVIDGTGIVLDVAVFDRQGRLVGRAG